MHIHTVEKREIEEKTERRRKRKEGPLPWSREPSRSQCRPFGKRRSYSSPSVTPMAKYHYQSIISQFYYWFYIKNRVLNSFIENEKEGKRRNETRPPHVLTFVSLYFPSPFTRLPPPVPSFSLCHTSFVNNRLTEINGIRCMTLSRN